MQYSINPFIHCEGCVKYWCGASQPFTLSIFNIIPLPMSFILHVFWNFLFVPHFLSLILYSSFILLLTFQEGWENGPSLKSLSLMFSVPPYVFDDKYGNKEASCHYYHPPTRKNITCSSSALCLKIDWCLVKSKILHWDLTLFVEHIRIN